MTPSFRNIALGAVAALSLSAVSATPAAAWCNGWGCGGGGWNAGPAVAAGVLGGMALGAAAASAAQPHYYAPAPVYGGGCWLERRPVYDQWGNYIGRRRVQVCE